MEPKQLVALALILLGGHFLLSNLGILPSLKVFWPVILIVVGLAALYQNSGKPKKTVTKDGEVIYEIDGDSTALKFLVGIPVAFIVGTVGLVVLGIMGPFFLIALLFVPIVLF